MSETYPIDPERLAALTTLKKGGHRYSTDGLCVMEAVVWVRGMTHTDHPNCVHPLLRDVCITINDRVLDDQLRTEILLPLVPQLVGTDNGFSERISLAALTFAKSHGVNIADIHSAETNRDNGWHLDATHNLLRTLTAQYTDLVHVSGFLTALLAAAKADQP